jgi:hypothetical protein
MLKRCEIVADKENLIWRCGMIYGFEAIKKEIDMNDDLKLYVWKENRICI